VVVDKCHDAHVDTNVAGECEYARACTHGDGDGGDDRHADGRRGVDRVEVGYASKVRQLLSTQDGEDVGKVTARVAMVGGDQYLEGRNVRLPRMDGAFGIDRAPIEHRHTLGRDG